MKLKRLVFWVTFPALAAIHLIVGAASTVVIAIAETFNEGLAIWEGWTGDYNEHWVRKGTVWVGKTDNISND